MRTKLGNNPRIRNLFTTFALGIRTNGCFFNRTEEVMKTQEIRIEDYNYSLPDERIAKFPLPKRDESKLLLYRNGEISESIFKHITDYLPQNTLMVFNKYPGHTSPPTFPERDRRTHRDFLFGAHRAS